MRTNEQTHTIPTRPRHAGWRPHPAGLRAARREAGRAPVTEGPWSCQAGERMSQQPCLLPQRQRGPSLCPAHTQMHTLTHSHTPDSQEGKTRSLAPGGPAPAVAPDGQVGPSQGRTGVAHATGPWPRPSRGSRKGRRLGRGWAPGGPGGLSPPPQERGGGATTWRLTSSYREGPRALPRSQASGGLVVYSVTNALFPS